MMLLFFFVCSALNTDPAPSSLPLISAAHPLILLQTSAAFRDSDAAAEGADRYEEADRHGAEITRVWGLVPEDLKPYCQLQIELRVRDAALRLELLRRILHEPQKQNVPISLQAADPHDEYVFEPNYVALLLQEFSCIRSVMLSEQQFEYYTPFNVERYAYSPHVRYSCDMIELAVQHNRHILIVLQGLKWTHIAADVLNKPLLEMMQRYPDYVIPVNEFIEPRHLVRQTSVWGLWLGGYTNHWGIEPQSWWYESSFMNGPGLFGDHQHPSEMPAALYRAMILQGAAMGADVYSFEPYWDLFDYENNRCWEEAILPTLREIIYKKMVPDREQVQEKTKAAYRLSPARDINEFHHNLYDLDWISDEGNLARALYGLWEPMLQFELIPNKSNWFVPLLAPDTPEEWLTPYTCIFEAGQQHSVEAWEEQLKQCINFKNDTKEAWHCSINGYSYVMHSQENLYERQGYRLLLPRPVQQIDATVTADRGLQLSWEKDPGAKRYFIHRVEDETETRTLSALQPLLETSDTFCTLNKADAGTYSITAETTTLRPKTGTVNYLDYLVFSETVSEHDVSIVYDGDQQARVHPKVEEVDDRPDTQLIFPTYPDVPDTYRDIAEEIVLQMDAFKEAYLAMDWRALTNCYAAGYEDANGFHREYVSRAWKWWFRRNNKTFLLRQIRNWNFDLYEETGSVDVTMLLFCVAMRRDDQPFGYDGLVRIPRHKGAELRCRWRKEGDRWYLQNTTPSLPNLEEILWNSRPMDKNERLIPEIDE
ncbi:MAG: hypothetical protein WCX86_11640 [Candidatus Hydrogenedentales bacterium]